MSDKIEINVPKCACALCRIKQMRTELDVVVSQLEKRFHSEKDPYSSTKSFFTMNDRQENLLADDMTEEELEEACVSVNYEEERIKYSMGFAELGGKYKADAAWVEALWEAAKKGHIKTEHAGQIISKVIG